MKLLIVGALLIATLFYWALLAGDGDQDEDDEKPFSGLLEDE